VTGNDTNVYSEKQNIVHMLRVGLEIRLAEESVYIYMVHSGVFLNYLKDINSQTQHINCS
jgi:hypothetical protein